MKERASVLGRSSLKMMIAAGDRGKNERDKTKRFFYGKFFAK